MRLFGRSPGGPWRQQGAAIPVMLGKNGLGWGLGLHGEAGEGPVKREGDGKAPAGIFRLGPAFGYAPAGTRPLKIAYTQMTDSFECVDDAESFQYNQVLDASRLGGRDWKSAEKMLRPDGEYLLGVMVEHNPAPARPGAGSCIFMHVWRNPGGYTSGCTAMARKDMERVAAWLDAAKSPVLVQLPTGERKRFQELYGAP